jgi:endonuclease III-like uncharacterized protein
MLQIHDRRHSDRFRFYVRKGFYKNKTKYVFIHIERIFSEVESLYEYAIRTELSYISAIRIVVYILDSDYQI